MKYDKAIKISHTKIVPQDLLYVSFDLFTRQECSQDSLTKSKVVLLHVYMELLNYIYVQIYIYNHLNKYMCNYLITYITLKHSK